VQEKPEIAVAVKHHVRPMLADLPRDREKRAPLFHHVAVAPGYFAEPFCQIPRSRQIPDDVLIGLRFAGSFEQPHFQPIRAFETIERLPKERFYTAVTDA